MGRVRKGSRELREQRGVKGVKGAKGSKGSEGSENFSILGFRVPTICDGKNFDDHI